MARLGAEVQSDTSAVATLVRSRRNWLDSAMGQLRNYEYVRQRAIVIADERGEPLVQGAHRTRFSGPPHERLATVIDSSVSGGGDAPFWREYATAPTLEDTLEWSRRLLADEPLVLSMQGPSYYHYTALVDTAISGVPIRKIGAELLPGTSRPGIQSGIFYVDAAADELVGFEITFAHHSLLFDEESRFRYRLAREFDGVWIPSEVRVSTFLNMPLSKGQRFDLRARYVDDVATLEE